MADSYRDIETALSGPVAFRGNSLHGRRQLIQSPFPEGGVLPAFVVYSYSTPVAVLDEQRQRFWIDPVQYSRTTSRGQNLCRRVWEGRGHAECIGAAAAAY